MSTREWVYLVFGIIYILGFLMSSLRIVAEAIVVQANGLSDGSFTRELISGIGAAFLFWWSWAIVDPGHLNPVKSWRTIQDPKIPGAQAQPKSVQQIFREAAKETKR